MSHTSNHMVFRITSFKLTRFYCNQYGKQARRCCIGQSSGCLLTSLFFTSTRLPSVTSNKVVVFIVTTVRMSNLTLSRLAFMAALFKHDPMVIWQLSNFKCSFSKLLFSPFAPDRLLCYGMQKLIDSMDNMGSRV